MPPIKPEEALKAKTAAIPDEVFDAFNALILKNLNTAGNRSVVVQEDAVNEIVNIMGCLRHDVFDNNWLDVELAYREAGWEVEYDKPAYNETYKAKFIFLKRVRRQHD